jgi:hypothetical protein
VLISIGFQTRTRQAQAGRIITCTAWGFVAARYGSKLGGFRIFRDGCAIAVARQRQTDVLGLIFDIEVGGLAVDEKIGGFFVLQIWY